MRSKHTPSSALTTRLMSMGRPRIRDAHSPHQNPPLHSHVSPSRDGSDQSRSAQTRCVLFLIFIFFVCHFGWASIYSNMMLGPRSRTGLSSMPRNVVMGDFVPSFAGRCVTATRGWMYICMYILGADVRREGIALRGQIFINNELISALLLFHFFTCSVSSR